jgi:glycine hydroxymethyltransferase
MTMKIIIGADHGGFVLKEQVKRWLETHGVTVDDAGCYSRDACDYPDIARVVASRINAGFAEQGILVCTTGIGMSIAANKFPRIRAALCLDPSMASTARVHNNANVLVLGGKQITAEELPAIMEAWFSVPPGTTQEKRHVRRIGKFTAAAYAESELDAVQTTDPEIYEALVAEIRRQDETINLIASENYASPAVREAQGSSMTNKYAEGYPGKRYYNGCEFVDVAERLAIERAARLFNAEHVNVQPHCGSSANMAVYFAALKPGDTILAMSLAHGGHLTHGHSVNFSGRLFKIVSYGVRRATERIDMEEVERLAREHRPGMIVVGASAYPRLLDFEMFRRIADDCGARLMVDMAHIAGLVAAGAHPSPVPVADFVTTTTHKTLRGPRSGMVLCKQAFAADLDKQVFPGLQGGPLMHTIASKAVCFLEALQPSFRTYGRQIVRNAAAMADALTRAGFRLVSGGTDNHLMLVDLSPVGLTGKDAAAALDRAGIIVNKNAIPFDTRSPVLTSGIRIGTPAMTTRGMQEEQATQIGNLIAKVLRAPTDDTVQKEVRGAVKELTTQHPVW